MTWLRFLWDLYEICVRFAWNLREICMRFAWDLHDICQRFSRDFPEIFLRLGWHLPEIFLKFSWSLPVICQRFAWDMHEICMRFVWDLHEICMRFAWDLHKICMKYTRNMFHIYAKFHLLWQTEGLSEGVKDRPGSRDAYAYKRMLGVKLNSATICKVQKYGHFGGKKTLVFHSILASKHWISCLMPLQEFWGFRLYTSDYYEIFRISIHFITLNTGEAYLLLPSNPITHSFLGISHCQTTQRKVLKFFTFPIYMLTKDWTKNYELLCGVIPNLAPQRRVWPKNGHRWLVHSI